MRQIAEYPNFAVAHVRTVRVYEREDTTSGPVLIVFTKPVASGPQELPGILTDLLHVNPHPERGAVFVEVDEHGAHKFTNLEWSVKDKRFVSYALSPVNLEALLHIEETDRVLKLNQQGIYISFSPPNFHLHRGHEDLPGDYSTFMEAVQAGEDLL